MLVKELARALGPHGIRVNAIAPGAIPGGGFKGRPAWSKDIPLGRFGTPADVAAMAIAVLSERFGAYVTGASIVVDGGIALHNWIEPRHASSQNPMGMDAKAWSGDGARDLLFLAHNPSSSRAHCATTSTLILIALGLGTPGGADEVPHPPIRSHAYSPATTPARATFADRRPQRRSDPRRGRARQRPAARHLGSSRSASARRQRAVEVAARSSRWGKLLLSAEPISSRPPEKWVVIYRRLS